MTATIYMVEREDGSYERVSRAGVPMTHVFEGVDGDEEKDTVTYWFRRQTKEDEQ